MRALFVLASFGILASLSLTVPNHEQIAVDRSIPGKLEYGECMPYALTLSKRLSGAGMHGRLIFYKWSLLSDNPESGETSGEHVFVEYQAAGAQWIVDNEHSDPIRVPIGASVEQMIWTLSDVAHAPAVRVEPDDRLNRLAFF